MLKVNDSTGTGKQKGGGGARAPNIFLELRISKKRRLVPSQY